MHVLFEHSGLPGESFPPVRHHQRPHQVLFLKVRVLADFYVPVEQFRTPVHQQQSLSDFTHCLAHHTHLLTAIF